MPSGLPPPRRMRTIAHPCNDPTQSASCAPPSNRHISANARNTARRSKDRRQRAQTSKAIPRHHSPCPRALPRPRKRPAGTPDGRAKPRCRLGRGQGSCHRPRGQGRGTALRARRGCGLPTIEAVRLAQTSRCRHRRATVASFDATNHCTQCTQTVRSGQ